MLFVLKNVVAMKCFLAIPSDFEGNRQLTNVRSTILSYIFKRMVYFSISEDFL